MENIEELLVQPQQQQTFDFEANKIETMTLETLRRTHQENNAYGDPLRGMYHYQVIERMGTLCDQFGLNYQIEEIFAAQNQNKTQPGVSLLPKAEEIYGPKAVEAHIIRRVYTTIRIDDGQTDELTTTLAIAFHQEGIQVAIGPCVKICHNQCILSPERRVSDYGKDKVSTEQLFTIVEGWLASFSEHMQNDRAKIERLKNTVVTQKDLFTYIGILTAMRVAHDSSDRALSAKVDTYPLNQSQISIFTEQCLLQMLQRESLTAWELYNAATELCKPGRMDVPALLPQNEAFAKTLLMFCDDMAA